MSDQKVTEQISRLERINAELMRSLRRCHVLVEDYRAHITPANSNEPPFLLATPSNEDEEPNEESFG